MVKSFKEFISEIIDHAFKKKVMVNPGKHQLANLLKNHPSKEPEYRYLHNTKTNKTYVADAEHFTHPDIAQHVGEHEFKRDWEGEVNSYNQDHYHAGFIGNHNINRILNHPKGLHGFIADAHKGLPDARKWQD